MKKSILVQGLVCAALSLAACSDDNADTGFSLPTQTVNHEVELFAVPDNSLGAAWVTADRLNVFHAAAGTTDYINDGLFEIAEEDLANNRFSGIVTEDEFSLEKSYDWYAVYPYDLDLKSPVNDEQVALVIGSQEDAAMTQIGDNSTAHLIGASSPLYGVAKNITGAPRITMQQLTSVIKLEVTHDGDLAADISSVEVEASTCELSGTYYIDITSGVPVFTPVKSSTKAVVNVEGINDYDPATTKTLYLPVKACELPAGEVLNITVTAGHKPFVTTLTLDEPLSLAAGEMTSFAVKASPMMARLEKGINHASGTLLWTKKLSEIVGTDNAVKVSGMTVAGGKVLLLVNGSQTISSLDAASGEKGADITIGAGDDFAPFHMTSDKAGNILVCNRVDLNGTFQVWKSKGVDQPFESYISHKHTKQYTSKLGWNISIAGSVDGNAIITAYLQAGGLWFGRWTVVDGALSSQTPAYVQLLKTGSNANNQRCGDFVYTSDTDVTADYVTASYSKFIEIGGQAFSGRAFVLADGAKNLPVASAPAETTNNTPITSADYIEFNNAKYVAYNFVNPFAGNLGTSDIVNLYEIDNRSFGARIDTFAGGVYGGPANDGQNSNWYGDVVLRAEGDYLYLYFMFANGQVGCIQYDRFE